VRTIRPFLTFHSVSGRSGHKVHGLIWLQCVRAHLGDMARNETRLVQRGPLFTMMLEGTLTIRASHVGGDRPAPDGANDGDVTAVLDLAQVLQLELACQVAADGTAIVRLRGELDIATADQAYAYLRDVVDSHDGPVLMNLSELTFCDAAGLGVLARVAGHARREGRSLELTAARPALLRIMHITGMDEAFPELRTPAAGVPALPRQPSVTARS
jgi:anti-anti-sigma factor